MADIKIAIAGLGNCASALIQGLEYYKKITGDEAYFHGLMNPTIGEYTPSDVKIVAAFDINKNKIGKDISKAIFEKPNSCSFISEVPKKGTIVKAAPVLDGCAPHMRDSFFCYDDDEITPVDVVEELKKSGAEILVNFLPVGSNKASRFYAQACLDAGVGFINCIPEFICSDDDWEEKFKEKNLPIAGDDIKSQVGATILHRVLGKLFLDRGVIVDKTYQLNIGGNTDFENMKMESRLTTKRISKTSAVSSVFPYDVKTRIGPSDYVPFLEDKKICYIRIDGITFGGLPLLLDAKLRVEDSPNSAGVVLDVIRCMKIALDRGIAGRLDSISSFSFKHPPIQPESDVQAKLHVKKFIEGKRAR